MINHDNPDVIQKLTYAQITGMANPPTGILFYDTTNSELMYYSGAWRVLASTVV